MLNHQTMERLSQMKLAGILEGFKEQLDNPAFSDLAFEERFGLLVDREYLLRDNRRLTRRFQEAHLKVKASVEDVDFHAPRGLDKRLFLELATCGWIGRRHNLVITGPTGGGKTYLACALAQKACREGKRCLYFHFPELLQELSISRAEGSQRLLVRKLATRDLLVIDDWLREPVSAEIARGLADLMDDRFRNKSTLFATQFPVAEWHGRFQDPTLADAVLDRIVHDSYRIELSGDSMRKRTSDLTKSAT